MQARSRDVELTALSLLDHPAPDIVGELLKVVRAATGAPVARFNVLSSKYQYTLVDSEGGDDVVDVNESLCLRVVSSSQRTHAVPDARLDERFAHLGFVTRGEVVGYAASQLVTSNGTPIGTVCVFGSEPSEWDERALATLEAVAAIAVQVIEADRAHKSMHEALSRLVRDRRELNQVNEQLSSFAGQIGADLTAPLASVTLGLSLLEEQLVDLGDGEQLPREALLSLVRSARGGAARAVSTTQALTEYSTAAEELRRRPVEVAQLVDETLIELSSRRGGTTVVVDELPVVQADPAQLRAVIANLIGNAFKHAARPGGCVVIDAVRAPGVVRLRVHDSGNGVPVEAREEIFGRGVRGADAVAEGREGMGIGLDTCRRVVLNHGGRIGVDTSDRMGGACFWVELPQARALPSPTCESSSPQTSSPAP